MKKTCMHNDVVRPLYNLCPMGRVKIWQHNCKGCMHACGGEILFVILPNY